MALADLKRDWQTAGKGIQNGGTGSERACERVASVR